MHHLNKPEVEVLREVGTRPRGTWGVRLASVLQSELSLIGDML